MQVHTQSWLASIAHPKEEIWNSDNPPEQPVFPSIPHELHPKLRELVRRLGVRKTLTAGESLFSTSAPVNKFMLVEKGITAREISSDSSNRIMAISTPNRIACGNLNLFTSHACAGRYFALVPSSVILVPQDLLKRIMRQDAELAWLFSMNNELCALSDRMTFAAMTMLDAEGRIKAFLLSWAANYAVLEQKEDSEGWLRMPYLIQRKYLQCATHTAKTSLDGILATWRKEGSLRTDSEHLFIRPSLLEDCYSWLARIEENSLFRRPASFIEFFAPKKKQAA